MWIKKLFNGKFNIVFGLVLGVVLMGGFSYAVDSLSSESVSYTKQDGKLTTVKNALDELISKSSKVDDLEKQVADYKKLTIYLADQVQVGDYVDYDAGSWNDTKEKPIEHGEFGGYSANQSKNSSVESCIPDDSHGSTTLKGWRVLNIDKINHNVTIVHAGTPECYRHAYTSIDDAVASINLLNEHGSQYVNKAYATSGRSITKADLENIDKENNLRKTNNYYWLATQNDKNQVGSLYLIRADGDFQIGNNIEGHSFGYRPVVELKPNIKTTGKGTDEFGQEAWQLVEMK